MTIEATASNATSVLMGREDRTLGDDRTAAAPDRTANRSASQQPARSMSCQDCGVERVLGIGGYFIRAADPAALGAWYRDCLGLDADEHGLWRQGAGITVFATFESDTDYFGSRSQQTMLNFRVRDLDAMLAQLRAKGADVAEDTQDMEGVGRFGWVTDPEGNRIELWQPA
jgi:predicted enzyme related to lactoylglutathione lyase